MRIFFSVGEPSGDLHASNLIRRLKSQQPNVECVGYGGPKMASAGCKLHFDLTQLAVMFIWEALKKIRQFLKLAKDADQYFAQHKVDAVVLIDYPGFNWWIAKRAKKHGIPVFFYGVPQMWAWGGWRIHKLRKRVDHVLCKLPFEAGWFAERNCQATYVGHPFFDQLHSQTFDEDFLAQAKSETDKLLLLLPGSRDQEVENHLPTLLRSASKVQNADANVKVAIACYNQKQLARAKEILAEQDDEQTPVVELYVERTPELMKAADACIACSGSVSLELLFHRKPTVIVYHPSKLAMFLQKFALKVKYITLVNLIATDDICRGKGGVYDPDAPNAEPTVMPEYLTTEDRTEQIASHVVGWFKNPDTMAAKVEEMDELAKQYALPGATERAADYVLSAIANLDYRRLSNVEVNFPSHVLDQIAESNDQAWLGDDRTEFNQDGDDVNKAA